MEGTVKIQVEKLPEGSYLATSKDIQGLVAQGRTIAETLEIARDVVKKLIEEQGGSLPEIDFLSSKGKLFTTNPTQRGDMS